MIHKQLSQQNKSKLALWDSPDGDKSGLKCFMKYSG